MSFPAQLEKRLVTNSRFPERCLKFGFPVREPQAFSLLAPPCRTSRSPHASSTTPTRRTGTLSFCAQLSCAKWQFFSRLEVWCTELPWHNPLECGCLLDVFGALEENSGGGEERRARGLKAHIISLLLRLSISSPAFHETDSITPRLQSQNELITNWKNLFIILAPLPTHILPPLNHPFKIYMNAVRSILNRILSLIFFTFISYYCICNVTCCYHRRLEFSPGFEIQIRYSSIQIFFGDSHPHIPQMGN